MELMLGLLWAKHLLFGGGKKVCRRSQRHNGEIAFLKRSKGLDPSKGADKLMGLANARGEGPTEMAKEKKGEKDSLTRMLVHIVIADTAVSFC